MTRCPQRATWVPGLGPGRRMQSALAIAVLPKICLCSRPVLAETRGHTGIIESAADAPNFPQPAGEMGRRSATAV